jgi:hypothetical protein
MGIDDHLHSSSQLVLSGLPHPSVDIQVEFDNATRCLQYLCALVYVIVWMRMCSAIHGLSRKLHCSIFDLLVRIDRQVPVRSATML